MNELPLDMLNVLANIATEPMHGMILIGHSFIDVCSAANLRADTDRLMKCVNVFPRLLPRWQICELANPDTPYLESDGNGVLLSQKIKPKHDITSLFSNCYHLHSTCKIFFIGILVLLPLLQTSMVILPLLFLTL